MWEILSEHAVPARRDLAWGALRRIPALTPDALYRAPARELADAVALTGLPREETIDRLTATAEVFRSHRDPLDLDGRRDLSLHAVWRRLAVLAHIDPRMRRRALLYALDVPVLPMDQEISRVVARLTRPGEATSARVSLPVTRSRGARAAARRWLAAQVPHDLDARREAVLFLRHHATHTCLPVGPHCQVCPLVTVCMTGRERLTNDQRARPG